MAYKNKEKERSYHHKYHLLHKDKKRIQKAERYQRIKEYQKEWSRKRYSENKELYIERNKLYAKTTKARFGNLKRRSKTRGYDVSLTLEQFEQVVSNPCTYCGDKPEIIGIDRQDNSIGYSYENSVSCCKTCNMMKHVLSITEFLDHIKRINNYQTNIN